MRNHPPPPYRKRARAAVGRGAVVVAVAAAIAIAPLGLTWEGGQLALAWHDAAAKDGKGRGGGDGKGGGNGNAGGNGNGGGNGNAGGSGKGKGKDKGGMSADPGAATGQMGAKPAAGNNFTIGGASVEVVHRNGMRERIRAGRYLMRDGKGRTIIERAATDADLRRLRGLAG